MSELPEIETVRKRIQKTPKKSMQNLFKFMYLTASRVSETVSVGCPNDTTQPVGPKGTNAKQAQYIHHNQTEPAAVFTLQTEKRGGTKTRKTALPLNPKYEPWTQELYSYFQKKDARKVFPFNRQKAWRTARKIFKGLRYPITTYTIFENGEILKTVNEHSKPFSNHALRHIRITELIDTYGFNGIDLSLFTGASLKTYSPTLIGAPRSLEKYTHLMWRKYFPKLLLRRN